jgi:hypothetical protein
VQYHIGTFVLILVPRLFLNPVPCFVSVFFYWYLEFSWIRYLVLYRYLIYYIGTLDFLESGTSFCIGTLSYNRKSGPAFKISRIRTADPRFMNPVPVRWFYLYHFVESTDPIIFYSDPRIELSFLKRISFFSWYRPNRFINLKIRFGSVFFLWIRSDRSLLLMLLFRIRDFCLRTDPDAYADYFLVWGDYRCPRPGLDFSASFRSETPVLNPLAVIFFSGVWIRKVGFWILRIFLDPHMVHSDPLLWQ